MTPENELKRLEAALSFWESSREQSSSIEWIERGKKLESQIAAQVTCLDGLRRAPYTIAGSDKFKPCYQYLDQLRRKAQELRDRIHRATRS